MPTYLNPTADLYMNYGVVVSPFDSIETYKILETPPLVKTSDEPYYNELLDLINLEFDEIESQEQLVDNDTFRIEISNRTESLGSIEVYINNIANTPYRLFVEPGQTKELYNNHHIEKLVLNNTNDNASVDIYLFKDPRLINI